MYPWFATADTFSNTPLNDAIPFNYCGLYLQIMYQKQTVKILKDFSMIIINASIATVFQILGRFQMMHTTIE